MKRSFWKGTIIGAVIGAVAGVLLAPKSGRETREELKTRVMGTYQDFLDRLEHMTEEVSGRVETLKEAARDLKGEARQESQELVRRAEALKQNLRVSATSLTKSGAQTKDVAIKEVKHLLGEGAEVMKELERVTKRLANSAKDKVQDVAEGER